MAERLFLIHWHEAEAEALAAGLREQGWTVELEARDGRRAYQAIRERPPAAVVIYLTRLPSHGRATAEALRSLRATREIPINFVGGGGEALQKTRARVPEAEYVSVEELPEALERLRRTTG